jgi:DNA polymerase V
MSEIDNEKPSGKHGGTSEGAGRKAGTGKFGEPNSVLRVSVSQSAKIKDFLFAYQQKRIKLDIDSVGEFE